jgi:hypothetical protein
MYATIPAEDYHRKPRVAEVFKDNYGMCDWIRGIEKRKRAKDQVNSTILSTNSQAT